MTSLQDQRAELIKKINARVNREIDYSNPFEDMDLLMKAAELLDKLSVEPEVAQLQKLPYVDRSDAVNLARNMADFGHATGKITRHGVEVLCDAVLKMDAVLLSAAVVSGDCCGDAANCPRDYRECPHKGNPPRPLEQREPEVLAYYHRPTKMPYPIGHTLNAPDRLEALVSLRSYHEALKNKGVI